MSSQDYWAASYGQGQQQYPSSYPAQPHLAYPSQHQYPNAYPSQVTPPPPPQQTGFMAVQPTHSQTPSRSTSPYPSAGAPAHALAPPYPTTASPYGEREHSRSPGPSPYPMSSVSPGPAPGMPLPSSTSSTSLAGAEAPYDANYNPNTNMPYHQQQQQQQQQQQYMHSDYYDAGAGTGERGLGTKILGGGAAIMAAKQTGHGGGFFKTIALGVGGAMAAERIKDYAGQHRFGSKPQQHQQAQYQGAAPGQAGSAPPSYTPGQYASSGVTYPQQQGFYPGQPKYA